MRRENVTRPLLCALNARWPAAVVTIDKPGGNNVGSDGVEEFDVVCLHETRDTVRIYEACLEVKII